MERDAIMKYFTYEHLSGTARETSSLFCALAEEIHAKLPRNAERTVALRKLLEAKDAAVRAAME